MQLLRFLSGVAILAERKNFDCKVNYSAAPKIRHIANVCIDKIEQKHEKIKHVLTNFNQKSIFCVRDFWQS